MAEKKLHIVIFRSTSAHDVFPRDPYYIKTLNDFPSVKYVHFSDVSGLSDMIKQFNRYKFPNDSLVQFIIQAHGAPDTLALGQDHITVDSPLWDRFTHFFSESVLKKLTHNGSIFLHSCSIARGKDSFAHNFSLFIPHHVIYGATDMVKMMDLQMSPSDKSLVSYQVSEEKRRPDYRVVALLEGVEITQKHEFELQKPQEAEAKRIQKQRQEIEAKRIQKQKQEAEVRRIQKQKQEAEAKHMRQIIEAKINVVKKVQKHDVVQKVQKHDVVQIPRCQCYKSQSNTKNQCTTRAKEPDLKYCGVHKTCQPSKIEFVPVPYL